MTVRNALVAMVALLIPSAARSQAAATPATGAAVLERMHSAFADKWYRTLTFVQRTTVHRGDSTTVATWYEAIRAPASLRIDFDSATSGNGVIYTVDSSFRVRAGAVTARAGGNVFLPLIEGVYTQPVARTVQDLAPYQFDLARVYERDWNGGRVWVVGATTPADSTSPQFWVDARRLVLVRMILAGGGDVRLGGYEAVGRGWLATRVEFYQGGALRQLEEYRDWKADPTLSPALFDPALWRTAPHWAVKHY